MDMTDGNEALWQRCVAFHGHYCGGLDIGFKAALLAAEILGASFSADEELVCIAENDACGIDAIQVALGCSIGKGNLLFHMTGKHVYSFYDRRTGRSVRLSLKNMPEGFTRDKGYEYYHDRAPESMFDVGAVKLSLPKNAVRFHPHRCEVCGEDVAENHVRIQDGKEVCTDCFDDYKRFGV
jgi:formylmethanofuran dehydrogenase subunit E